MTRQKHAKHSLLGALESVLRRARTSLYQPSLRSPLPLHQICPVELTSQPVRTAKIIPFPSPSESPITDRSSHPHPVVITRKPPTKVPTFATALWSQVRLR